MNKMNKKELIALIADDAGITKDAAGAALESVTDNIVKALKKGGDVRLPGFGTFKVTHRKARTARNPQTGATIQVKASDAPKFTPAKAFKEALN